MYIDNLCKYRTFNFWCQKVLPLVYDDSLSYYEVLCKAIEYINNLIKDGKVASEEIKRLQEEINAIIKIIENPDVNIEKIIEKYLATMIFVEINDSGYITYYIPESWKNIEFNTTDLDIEIDGYDYGHLVLSY